MVYLHLGRKIVSIVDIFFKKDVFLFFFLKKDEGIRVKLYNHLYDL